MYDNLFQKTKEYLKKPGIKVIINVPRYLFREVYLPYL